MPFISESQKDNILHRAWRTYAMIQNLLSALEKIGIEVDGSSDEDPGGMRDLHAISSEAFDTIYQILGVPFRSPWLDRADVVLSGIDCSENPELLPAEARQALEKIASEAIESDMPRGEKQFEVTVAMAGGITIRAADGKAAIAAVNAMDSDQVRALASWDSSSATDAYENSNP